MAFIKKNIIENFWKSWKNWNYLHKILFLVYSICYTRYSSHSAWCDCRKLLTVFPQIASVPRKLFFIWKWKMWKFSYSFHIMFYFINWIVAAESIELFFKVNTTVEDENIPNKNLTALRKKKWQDQGYFYLRSYNDRGPYFYSSLVPRS